MTMPFYSSVDQLLRDRSELARKGIARGRSVVDRFSATNSTPPV